LLRKERLFDEVKSGCESDRTESKSAGKIGMLASIQETLEKSQKGASGEVSWMNNSRKGVELRRNNIAYIYIYMYMRRWNVSEEPTYCLLIH
jgi:hypothetical protein